ncbi:MAG: NarK/NasA family nitrate transporter, partial [Alphaproteobacteria bacterium]|nr:NarK/NasA family nitrate transporter [Alphaproteobacteria bacterium]
FSFMVWVILGPLGVLIAADLHLSPGDKGLMVATPILAGAFLRILNGVLVDRFKAKRVGIVMQCIVIGGLLGFWFIGISNFAQILALGIILGIAGSSFAIALPLASYWYPPEHQGTALGVAGAGNSGTVLASLFVPAIAIGLGWRNALGLAAIPLAVVLVAFVLLAKDSPRSPPPKAAKDYFRVLAAGDAWWLMFFYSVTFGGFVGLSSFLPIYFHDQYGLSAIQAGYFTAACVFAGSFLRPVGGWIADQIGGLRALSCVYAVAAVALLLAAMNLPQVQMALVVFLIGMGALGMGNGAVFQLVPQRFGREVGVMTGLVGMTGGVGGFYLAVSLGYTKQFTGNYSLGYTGFALLALIALASIASFGEVWRKSWASQAGLVRARV